MYIRTKLLSTIHQRWNNKDSSILLLEGGRETGKTTLLQQIKDDMEYPDFLQRIIFAFDQEGSCVQFENEIQLLGFLQLKTGLRKEEETLLLLNEIQYSKNIIEILCKLCSHYPHIHVVATTSGMDFQDHVLSKENTAKIKKLGVTPYRFEEYLAYHEINYQQDIYTSLTHEIKHIYTDHFERYLKFGSFPRVLEAKSEGDKINAIKYIVKKYIDTDARFWFSGDFLITCEKAIGPLHSVTDQLLKPISLAKILKLSPYNTKKIVAFFLQTHCFGVVPCYEDIYDRKNTLHGHETIYSIDTGLLHHYVPFALSTEIYYKTFVANELLWYRGKDRKISTYRKRNGTQIDFLVEDKHGNITVVLCEDKNTGNIPRRLNALPSYILEKCSHIIVCTPNYIGTTTFQNVSLEFCSYYWLPQILMKHSTTPAPTPQN